MKKRYLVISLLIIMLFATGCFIIQAPAQSPIPAPSPPPSADLKILGHSLTREDSGKVVVKVTVKNVGSSTIELAQVKVTFQGKEGEFIDSSSDAVMNLGAGETWNFEFTCTGTRCDHAKGYQLDTTAGTSYRQP
ncbi:FxLYD domain-containing protein [Chloroflexota bacterium]